MTKHSFKIREMSESDARSLIQRNHIGRLAFTLRDRVDIEPISYVCDGDWIILRTSEGRKIEVIRHHPWVAFQVDEIHARTDWESVVIHGRVQILPEDGSPGEVDLRERALDAIRRVDADALGDGDGFRHRTEILRLHIDNISARRSTSREVPGQ